MGIANGNVFYFMGVTLSKVVQETARNVCNQTMIKEGSRPTIYVLFVPGKPSTELKVQQARQGHKVAHCVQLKLSSTRIFSFNSGHGGQFPKGIKARSLHPAQVA